MSPEDTQRNPDPEGARRYHTEDAEPEVEGQHFRQPRSADGEPDVEAQGVRKIRAADDETHGARQIQRAALPVQGRSALADRPGFGPAG